MKNKVSQSIYLYILFTALRCLIRARFIMYSVSLLDWFHKWNRFRISKCKSLRFKNRWMEICKQKLLSITFTSRNRRSVIWIHMTSFSHMFQFVLNYHLLSARKKCTQYRKVEVLGTKGLDQELKSQEAMNMLRGQTNREISLLNWHMGACRNTQCVKKQQQQPQKIRTRN